MSYVTLHPGLYKVYMLLHIFAPHLIPHSLILLTFFAFRIPHRIFYTCRNPNCAPALTLLMLLILLNLAELHRVHDSTITPQIHLVQLHLSVCLSVCPVPALSFDSLDLETSSLVCRYIFIIVRSALYIKVIGSRSRSQEQKHICFLF